MGAEGLTVGSYPSLCLAAPPLYSYEYLTITSHQSWRVSLQYSYIL